jgi:hypothetical protein
MKVAEHVRAHGQEASKLKFLVFESLAESRVELRTTLANLITHFGDAIRPGVTVVVSKYDTRSGPSAEVRLTKIMEVMEEFGLATLVPWQSVGLDPEGQQEQFAVLKATLDEAAGVSTTDLQFFWQRQHARQQQLYDGQSTRIKKEEIEETYSQPYSETESYTEVESYQSQETRTRSVPRSRVVKGEPQGPFLKDISFRPDSILSGSIGFEFTQNPHEAIRGLRVVHNRGQVCWSCPLEPISLNFESPPDNYYSHYDEWPKRMLWVYKDGDAPPVTAVTILQLDSDPPKQHGDWTVLPGNLMQDWHRGAPRYLGYQVAKVPDRTVTDIVEETFTENVPKLRSVTKSRQVTRYRQATRKVIKDVQYRLAFEDFYYQAYDEVLSEIRRDFAASN